MHVLVDSVVDQQTQVHFAEELHDLAVLKRIHENEQIILHRFPVLAGITTTITTAGSLIRWTIW